MDGCAGYQPDEAKVLQLSRQQQRANDEGNANLKLAREMLKTTV